MLVDGEPVELIEYTYVSARMGVSSVSGEVRTRRCLDELWTGREFVEFRGERFFLDHVPSSSKSNEDERYVHSLEFRAGRDILLSGVYFCDAVAAGSASADRPQSNSYDVKFVGTLDDFVQRFNDVLAYRGLDERFSVSVESGIVGTTESKEIAFSDVTLFAALGKAVEVWEVPFYFEGDSAVFGSADGESLVPVEYGADKELLSVSMNNRGEKTVTRISGVGGTDNVPYYYPNPSPKGTLGVGGTASGVTIRDMVSFSQKVGSGDVLTYLGKEADFGWIQLDFGGKTGRNATGGVTAVVEDVNVASGTLYPFRVSLGADLSQGFADVLRVPLYANVGNTEQIPGTTDLYYVRSTERGGSGGAYLNVDYLTREGADVAQKGWELVVDRVEVVFGSGNNSVTRQVEFECDYSQPEIAPEDRGLYPERVLSGIVLDFGEIIASLPSGADLSACTVYIVGHLSSHVLWQVSSGSGFAPAGFQCETMSVNGEFAPQGWFLGEAGLGQDLSVVGLAQSGDPVVGSTITQTVLSYITPTGVLMPSIYRQSGGASRFYDALNDTYTDPETGGYYTFEHEYDPLNPHEHVESFEDVYPTIRNLKDGSGNPLNVLSDVWFDPGFNVRDLLPDGQTLKYQYFFVKLKALGFNLFDCAIEDGDMALVMSDGPCAGCHFKILVNSAGKNPVQRNTNGTLKKDASGYGVIDNGSLQEAQQDTTSNNVWVALYLDDSTFGGGEYGTMPAYDKATGVGPKPSAGDSFTVENILLPQAFFTAAEQELDRQLIKFMAEHNADKFDPSVTFSRVYLAQNPSVRAALSEKSRLSLTYDGRTFSPLYVSQFTLNVKEGEALPEIIVETSDIVEQRSSGLDDRISAITMQTVRAVVPSPGSDIRETDSRYLRKDAEDTAKEKIIFEKGLEVGDYRPGRSGLGGTIYTNSAGEAIAEVDFLTVRRKAVFSSVEVDALRKVSGTILLSLAEMQCNAVEKVSGGWKCYFKTDTGEGSALENGFAAGDQAICQTFLNNNTHYYWRLVTEVGPDYIVLSESDCDAGSDAPEVRDTIVQLGNRSDTSRQAAQVLSCYGSDSPSHVMYAGINSYDLTGRDIWGVVYTQNGSVWEPRFYNYGSMLLGSRDKSGDYVEFDTLGGMTIKADVLIKAGSALANAIAAAGAMSEVEKAFNNDTKISGGLVLTSLIQLGQQSGSDYTVWSGINGLANADRYGKGIAAWYGGPMADLEHPLAGESVFAQSLFRFDGSGYLAGGNIHWNNQGYGGIPGITWSNDGTQDIVTIGANVRLASIDGDTVTDLLNAVNQLTDLFEIVNGNIHVKNNRGFYSDSFISAGGLSDGGGSAGGNATLVAQTYGGTLSATGVNPINFYSKEKVDQLIATAGTVQTVAGLSPVSGDIPVASLKSALGIGAAAAYGVGSVASGDTGLVTGGSVYSAINEAVSSVLKMQGTTTTAISDGSTTNPVVIDGSSYTAKKGDVVMYGNKEFWWTGSAWEELGDEASWALKTTTISAGTGLTGGGSLASNRTISLSAASIASLALADSAYQKPSTGIPKTDLASGVQTSLGKADSAYQKPSTGIPQTDLASALSTKVDHGESAYTNLNDWFEIVDGNIHVKNNRGFYSDSFISAGGLSSGGGSEGVSLAAVWASLNTNSDDYANEKINAYHIPIGTGLSVVNGLIVANNAGTVTSVKVGTTTYNPTDGVVSLPAYPTTLPASDVYAWAKASTKPSYTFSEITGTVSASQLPDLSGTYQPLDADLTAIAGLTGTSGFLKKTAANTWALDSNTYLTGITSAMVTNALGYTPADRIHVIYDPSESGVLVKTDLAATSSAMLEFVIEGNGYSTSTVVFSRVQAYNYPTNDAILSGKAINYGTAFSSFSVFNYNGYIYLWFPRLGTYQTFRVSCFTQTDRNNHVDKITSAGIPSGATRRLDITPKNAYTTANLTKSVLTTLLESSDGYYVKKSGDTMTGALTVTAQVVPVSMEFRNMSSSAGHGGYIDFHFNNSTADYTSRIIESASGSISVLANLCPTTIQLGDGVLSWDSANSAWKLTGNFYATGFISAGGVSDGGGTSGVDLAAVWASLTANTGEGLNKVINVAHIPALSSISGNLTVSRISDIETWISGKGYLTAHQSLDGYVNDLTRTPMSGGNYVSAVTKSGKTIMVTYATLPTALKNPNALTFGSKTYDGSAARTITASDLGALTAHQTVTLASGTNDGTLKLTVGSTTTDNIAVTGLGSMAYKSSLSASDIPTLAISKISGLQDALDAKADASSLASYVLKAGDTITGSITFNETSYDATVPFVRNITNTGGWTRGVVDFQIGGSTVFRMGASGYGSSLNYGYIYTAGNDALRFYADGSLTYGTNTIWHAGNSNLSTVPWAASTLTAATSVTAPRFYLNAGTYFELDSDGYVHLVHPSGKGLYVDGFISAGGVSSGGGTSGVDLTAVWNNLIANTGEGLNKKIHTSHLPTVTITGTNISGTATYSGTGGSASTLTLNLTAVDTTYSAGTGISISASNVISLNGSEYYSATTSRTANTVLAAPNGSNGAAGFRALVAADIPTLTKSKISDFPTNVSAFTNDAGYITSYIDTKNTAGSTNTSSKIFLIGATSQAANPQTYSHDTVYVGTDGHLYSDSKQVVNISGSQALTNKTYNGYTLAAACAKGVTDNSSNADVTSTDTNLITGRTLYYQLAKKGYTTNTGTVTSIVAGTGLSGGTITTSGTISLTASGVTAGTYYKTTVDTYGRVTSGSYANLSAAINGDLTEGSSNPVDADFYIAQYAGGGTSTTSYHRRPHSALYGYINGKLATDHAGLDKVGTVTSVAVTVPTGLSVSGSPITTSGTLAFSLASGYSIPTTAKQSNWDTAYGWGNNTPYMIYDPGANGVLVQTNCSGSTMLEFIIEGNSYQSNEVMYTRIQCYYFSSNNRFLSARAINYGVALGPFTVYKYNGVIYLWFARLGTYQTFRVSCYTQLDRKNHVVSVSTGAIPDSDVTATITITPAQGYHSRNANRSTVAWACSDLTASGNIVASGAITAGSASDARLKTNIQSLSAESAKRIVMALNPVTFTWNEKAGELYDQYKGDDLGMLAQEVEPYLPSAVGTIFEKYKRLDYTKVISPLVKVAQDHETRIRQLEARVAELEMENERLRS